MEIGIAAIVGIIILTIASRSKLAKKLFWNKALPIYNSPEETFWADATRSKRFQTGQLFVDIGRNGQRVYSLTQILVENNQVHFKYDCAATLYNERLNHVNRGPDEIVHSVFICRPTTTGDIINITDDVWTGDAYILPRGHPDLRIFPGLNSWNQ